MIRVLVRQGINVFSADNGVLVAERHGYRMALHGISGLEPALRLLCDRSAGLDELLRRATAECPGGGNNGRELLSRALRMLAKRQLIEFQCVSHAGPLLGAVPLGQLSRFDLEELKTDPAEEPEQAPGPLFQISRFACLHRVGERLFVECPQRSNRIIVMALELGSVIAALTQPKSLSDLTKEFTSLPESLTRECIQFLAAFGVIGQVEETGRIAEDADPSLMQREFHDVLMHMHSRRGLTDGDIGAVFPFVNVIAPAPAIKPPMSDRSISLPSPDLDHILQADPPLAKVMEERRSLRTYGDRPLSVEELGEFLYRVARVRAIRQANARDPRDYEATDRTYPSGGATYDLEIYAAVRQCDGIAQGFYHYEPVEHAMTALPCRRPDLEAMLYGAYVATGQKVVPQVLFVFASRFARLSWKYRGIAYATTLRNVGVLYEAMYLAATAMRLAPCAVGTGDSALFGSVTSLHPLVESSVGEFMLGVPPQRSAEDQHGAAGS
jgi:SagB-type dehydrogenase family enzyme